MTPSIGTMEQANTLFGRDWRWLKICLLVMFLLAALIRRDEIKVPGHLLDREYTSAIFARAFYFMSNDQVEDWRRDIAVTTMNQQPVLEPPLVEYLVSLIYRVMGWEEIYYAPCLTGAFWLVPVILALSMSLYFAYRTERASLYQVRVEPEHRTVWKIGEIIGHSPHTVFVSCHYGLPLEYYDEFGGAPWPVRIEDPFYRQPGAHERSVQERIDELGFRPEYFVITYFNLYQRKHQDLETYLESSCSTRLETTDYLIFSHCQTLSTHY